MIEWDLRLVVAERIGDGIYPPLTLISEVKLQEEFDVARVTIRKAMEALRERELITTKPGKGSIVSPQKSSLPISGDT
ncbi:GntR family transcriptional regulator [Nonomuraea sp. NPDC005692]|uniref:GntR family transcriptional regulator n=1 Tax=Nonomuraea sp. NPDC005692 TaxID=3157168 RepID=UPI0033CA75FD